MRRLIVVGLVAVVLSLSVTASATSSEHYKDRFSSIGWGGSDGSLQWSGPWSELNDDGDEKKGSVRVVSSGHCANGNCMRIAGILSGTGARRTAPTGDLEDLSLRYDLKNLRTLPLLDLTSLVVEVRGDGEWVRIAEHDLGEGFSGQYTHDALDEFRSESFQVRFLVSGAAMTSEVYIDNVEVRGVPDEELSTTTTTTAGDTTTTTTPVTTTTTTPVTTTTTTTEPQAKTKTAEQPAASSSSSTTTSTTIATGGRDDGATSNSPPSTTIASTTTTTRDATASSSATSVSAGADGGSSGGSGIRAAARGLQASFRSDLFGDVRAVDSLGGVDLQADYAIAVEVIRSSWAWMVLLGLVTAWAMVSGLDRRRAHLDA